MSYITANKSLSSRLVDESRVSGSRRRSSLLPDTLIAGSNTGTLFELPPVERQARFEEWIKLTTDNKINTSNSWGVALIDYFHDMDVFREGDEINFQKLSTTLDGCVKVYSSRIDSVITETGKLLSGLTTRKEGDDEEEEEGEGSDEEDNGDENNLDSNQEKKSKRVKKNADSTLKKWKDVKMRSLEQELSIDPLFKKTLAEFDEGGAKSLLMHMLNVDDNIRIMFDTSTGATVENFHDSSRKSKRDRKINITSLKSFFFNDSDKFDDNIELCPSLPQLTDVVEDIEKAKTVLKDINYDASYNLTISGGNVNNSLGSIDQEAEAVILNDFDNDNFADGVEFDNNDDDESDNDNEKSGIFANTTVNDADGTEMDNKVLNYFDEQLKSNWTGPMHWKVRALKRNFKEFDTNKEDEKPVEDKLNIVKKVRKEEFKIDFFNDEVIDDEKIFTVNKNPKLNMAMKLSDDFNLLPDDTFFSSKNLIELFTKPDQTLKLFKTKKIKLESVEEIHDENFWANNYDQEQDMGPTDDFGGDDNDDDDDDIDLDLQQHGSQEFGTQILTNQKSNRRTVNFARVAKRVDLALLKDNIWHSMEKETKQEEDVMEFKNLIRNTVKVYPQQEKKDLSTSFEFILLLHLANEKGFVIKANEDHSDLFIHFNNNV